MCAARLRCGRRRSTTSICSRRHVPGWVRSPRISLGTITRSRRRPRSASLEVRIGEVLGPPENHGPATVIRESQFYRNQVKEFRKLAANPDLVDDVIEGSSDADPPSRAKILRAIETVEKALASQRTSRQRSSLWAASCGGGALVSRRGSLGHPGCFWVSLYSNLGVSANVAGREDAPRTSPHIVR